MRGDPRAGDGGGRRREALRRRRERWVGEVSLEPDPLGDGITVSDSSYLRNEGFTIAGPPGRCIAARGTPPTDPMLGLQILYLRCEGSGAEGFYLDGLACGVLESEAAYTELGRAIASPV